MAVDGIAGLLTRHVVEPWFERTIDPAYGGFRCDFDRRWRPCGPDRKLLEYQARQTLSAAELLLVLPGHPILAEAVRIGFAFLREVLWDPEFGGWHAATDRAGSVLRPEEKHSHGMAYAVQACFAVHAATGDAAALSLANEALAWTADHARDPDRLGYFGPLRRDGRPIRSAPPGRPLDPIGTPFGLKDMNVNSDFYEALAYAAAVPRSHASTTAWLEEMREVILFRYACADGPPWHLFAADWTPSPPECRPATAAQTACRLLEDVTAPDPEANRRAARRLFDWGVRHGWDERRHALHVSIRLGSAARDRKTLEWWAQFELLRAASYFAASDGDPAAAEIRSRAERCVRDQLLDDSYGGSGALVRSALSWSERWVPGLRDRRGNRKAHMWKDASHDARTLVRLMLLADGEPIAGPPRRRQAAGTTVASGTPTR